MKNFPTGGRRNSNKRFFAGTGFFSFFRNKFGAHFFEKGHKPRPEENKDEKSRSRRDACPSPIATITMRGWVQGRGNRPPLSKS
jgi:hypothetical protein